MTNSPVTGTPMTGTGADVLNVIRGRRTARAHAAAALPAGAVEAVLEAARWAPSAANRQPWEFIVVADLDLKRRLRAAFLAEAEARDPKYRAVTAKQADLLLAPGLILVCGDPDTKSRYVNAAELGDAVQEELFVLSMGAAIQNMLLMATALGLSSTWIARAARLPTVRGLLGVPERLRGIAFVALGPDPAGLRAEEGMRHPIAGKTHLDRHPEGTIGPDRAR